MTLPYSKLALLLRFACIQKAWLYEAGREVLELILNKFEMLEIVWAALLHPSLRPHQYRGHCSRSSLRMPSFEERKTPDKAMIDTEQEICSFAETFAECC